MIILQIVSVWRQWSCYENKFLFFVQNSLCFKIFFPNWFPFWEKNNLKFPLNFFGVHLYVVLKILGLRTVNWWLCDMLWFLYYFDKKVKLFSKKNPQNFADVRELRSWFCKALLYTTKVNISKYFLKVVQKTNTDEKFCKT